MPPFGAIKAFLKQEGKKSEQLSEKLRVEVKSGCELKQWILL